MLMEKKTLLETNNKKKMIYFYHGKFFSSCYFALQSYILSMNCVNLCKFVASFPGVLAVSCTWICYKNYLFLAHWVGNFSTISLNQICCLLSLSTFQDSHNNKCQSIQTVVCFLKTKLSSVCIIQDEQTNN